MKIGEIPVVPAAQSSITRLTMLLWGSAGCGKTTFACTAPGRKLLINLDPDGPKSVTDRKDTHIIDLSSMTTDDVLKQLKSANNPLNLNKFLQEHEFDTIILDSVTNLAQRCLEQAVSEKIGRSSKFIPTMETPGLSAYGGRNAKLLICLKGLLRVTGKHNKHCIFVAHEDDPERDEKGNVLYISIMLGGKLTNHLSLQISEIWWLQDAKQRRVAFRPCRSHKPMKTRIIKQDKEPEFIAKFKPGGTYDELDKIYTKFVKGKGKKLSVTDM